MRKNICVCVYKLVWVKFLRVFFFVQSVWTSFFVPQFSCVKVSVCKNCSVQTFLCVKGSVCKSACVFLFVQNHLCAKYRCLKIVVYFFCVCAKASARKNLSVHKPLCERIFAHKN